MYNLTSRQAKGFLSTVKKHMEVFRGDAEFGWSIVNQDVREFITVHTNKYDCNNTVKSFPCALSSSDATIDFVVMMHRMGWWWGRWKRRRRRKDRGVGDFKTNVHRHEIPRRRRHNKKYTHIHTLHHTLILYLNTFN